MAHTITAADHLSTICEDGFSYSYGTGFHYEGVKRMPFTLLQEKFALDVEDVTPADIDEMDRELLGAQLFLLNIPVGGTESEPELRVALYDAYRALREIKLQRGLKMTKKELSGQLRLYGIEFKSSLNVPMLRELLIESIKQGKCKEPTEKIKKLECHLRKRYQELDKVHTETLARQRQEQFDKQYPATNIAAIVNPKMFISRHFLAPDGTPDPAKTPDPLTVYGLPSLLTRQVENAVMALIWGPTGKPITKLLYTREYGPTDGDKVLTLGWDRDAVWDAARRAAQPLYNRQAAEDKEKKKARLGRHNIFVRQLCEEQLVCDMKTIRGRYYIMCKEIEKEWPDDARKLIGGMKLRILPEVGNLRRNLIAEFHFGILEGLMRLRPAGLKPSYRRTERDIVEEEKKQEQSKKESKVTVHVVEGKKENDHEEEPSTTATSSTMRKRKTSEPILVSSKKWRGHPESENSTPTIDPNKLRLVFEFRARETDEGCLTTGTGWIEWDRKNSTKFEGRISTPYIIGSAVEFYGYKTDTVTKTMRPSSEWGDYYDDPYGLGPRNRWHF